MGKKKGKKQNRQEFSGKEMKTSQGIHNFSLRTQIWYIAAIVGLITFLVFLPALNNGFVNWDDNVFIYNNQHIRSMEFEFFTWAFTNKEHQWSPLRWISHALDYKFWQLNPKGHHLSANVIHSLNVFLVVILITRLLKIVEAGKLPTTSAEEKEQLKQRVIIAGAVTGLLFGIHPLRVESVVWLSERKDVLYAFFFLLSLISYLHYCRLYDKKKRFLYYLLTLIFFIMAVMSKATAVALPLVLVLLDFYPLDRIDMRSGWSSLQWKIIEKLPFLVISGAIAWINIGVHEEKISVPSVNISFIYHIMLIFKVLPLYLKKIIWPFSLSLYYKGSDTFSMSNLGDIILCFLTIIIIVSCIFLWRRGKKVWLATLTYYIIMLLPMLAVKTSASFVHDRYSYMASIGPSLLIGVGTAILMGNIRKNSVSSRIKSISIVLVLVLLFSVLAVLTVKQTKIWGNSFVLWNSLTERDPSFLLPYMNRAELFASSSKHREAIKELDKAAEINPKFTKIYTNRGMSYMEIDDYESAIKDFSTVIELNPGYIETAKAYNNRALAYMKKGDYRQVIDDLSKAIELEPLKHVKFYINRCEAYYMIKEYEPAISDCSRAIQMDSKSVRSYRARGTVYSAMGKTSDAISDFQNAARLGDRKAQEFLKAKGISW